MKTNNMKLLIALIAIVVIGVTVYLCANSNLIKGSMFSSPVGKKATIQNERKLLPVGAVEKKVLPVENSVGASQLPAGNGVSAPDAGQVNNTRAFGDGGGPNW